MVSLSVFVFVYVFVPLMLPRSMSTKAENKKGEEQLKESVNAIMSEINSLKDGVSSNDVLLSAISKKQDSFTENYENFNGEIHDINCKIEKIEQDVVNHTSTTNFLCERLLALELYSRGFNLRFYNIPEQTDEVCIDTLEKTIAKDLSEKPAFENAHRFGALRIDGSPRPIIAKFLCRPERRDILRKKKLLTAEDLAPEGRKRKDEPKIVMQNAYENGKHLSCILMAYFIMTECYEDHTPWYEIRYYLLVTCIFTVYIIHKENQTGLLHAAKANTVECLTR